eukprot:SAG11_NODE_2344_length_3487_cov_28.493506_1_plen_45_part_10
MAQPELEETSTLAIEKEALLHNATAAQDPVHKDERTAQEEEEEEE